MFQEQVSSLRRAIKMRMRMRFRENREANERLEESRRTAEHIAIHKGHIAIHKAENQLKNIEERERDELAQLMHQNFISKVH